MGDEAMTQSAGGETAQIPGDHGTPEQRLDYALTEAGRRAGRVYAIARAHEDRVAAQRWVDKKTAAREGAAVYAAELAAWKTEVASAVAVYAREIGAAATPARPATDGQASAYRLGWRNGADMDTEAIIRRPRDYGWPEYVAGYAEGARLHAAAATAHARALRQPSQGPPESPGEPASPAITPDKGRSVPGEESGSKASTPAAKTDELKAAADRYGLTVTAELAHDFNPVTGKRDGKVIDATVTVEGRFKRGDAQACIATLTNAGTVLGMVRMIRPGSVWGTPETVAEQMTGGRVRMSKSGAEIAVARRLTPAKAAKPEPSIPRRQRPRQHVLPQTRGRSR